MNTHFQPPFLNYGVQTDLVVIQSTIKTLVDSLPRISDSVEVGPKPGLNTPKSRRTDWSVAGFDAKTVTDKPSVEAVHPINIRKIDPDTEAARKIRPRSG